MPKINIFFRSGCDQWHFGSDASNYIQTFNFQGGRGNGGKHLANQHQSICIRYVYFLNH